MTGEAQPLARERLVPPPVIGDPPELRTPEVHRYRLANGLRVLVVEQRGLPIVDMQLVIRTGAATDGADFAGLASLAVDLLDEGAGNRSAIDIAESIEDLGAALSSGVFWDDSALSLHVHTDRITPALAILADIVIRPTIPQVDFERKQRERLTALLQEREEPRILAARAFGDVVFGSAHPYGRPLHGSRRSVERFTREHLVAFHKQSVRPGNAFLVVVGDVRSDAVVELLELTFRGWTDAPAPVAPVLDPPPRQPTAIHVVDRPGSGQSEVRVGCVGVPRSTADYFSLLVMNTILGGSFTSRLNLNLRQDKGWTYGASSSFGFRRSAGPFTVSTAVDTAVTASAVAEIFEEIAGLRERLVPADELARAQSYIALGLPRSFETTADIAAHVAELEIYGLGDDYFDGYVRRVRDVAAGDVLRVAQAYLDPSAMAVVIAGDLAQIQKPLNALGIGPVISRPAED
ncbi:MAG: pitrilysin family protein [Longimicrobiales bacterium]